jgi:nicotinamidase/pyrazinamidase
MMRRSETAVRESEITLLIIDPQNDFHPGGSLAIPTADDDAERIAAFITKHTRCIDAIVITLDSHQCIHIAHSTFWLSPSDEHPAPFTIISLHDIARGAWRAADTTKQLAAEGYARQLEERGRFEICIWPEHCVIGTVGHNVRPVIVEAANAWARSNMKEITYVSKGENCLTEMYSALRAEVPDAADASTLLNVRLLGTLKESSRLFVCGQALSHCVQFTVRDLVESYEEDVSFRDRIGSINILHDCTSAVPGFEEEGKTFLADMKSKGVRIVTTDCTI